MDTYVSRGRRAKGYHIVIAAIDGQRRTTTAGRTFTEDTATGGPDVIRPLI